MSSAKTRLLLTMFVAFGAACAERWPAGPFVWAERGAEAFEAAVPASQRVPECRLLYATDRAAVGRDDAGPTYGHGRSRQVAYGEVDVGFDPQIDWPTLVAATADPRGVADAPHPVVVRREELARFGRGPADLVVKDGLIEPSEATIRREEELRAKLTAVLGRRLGATDRRDVYVFVHGFNNSFDEVATRLAALWHAMGRPGVALAYTWPAGTSVFGYFYDRESGEFTVRHLKFVLEFLAADPAVERVHLIAHSRGTDVACDALRELHLANVAASRPSQAALKLETLVLAAPDLDTEVFDQRFLKERVYQAAKHTTVYLNREDGAIGVASFIFGSGRRLGGLRVEDLDADSQALLGTLPDFEIVECAVRGRSGGHDYVFRDPSALSDLAILLRDGAAAGSPARPLERISGGFWRMSNDYLRPASRAAAARLTDGRARVDY